MYEIAKSVIRSESYELSAMCHKINTLWMAGELSQVQRDELLTLARKKADPGMSVNLYLMYSDLEGRVTELEKAAAPEDPAVLYPNYVAGHTYRRGDGVTFQGAKYKCIAPEGVACVWSPADYPDFWEKV